MNREFWLQRWQSGRTGFHRNEALPMLTRHWPSLGLAPGSRVLVPLAGKSLDMIWLTEQGFSVLGVELSPRAIEQFLLENDLRAHEHDSAQGRHFVVASIELICGDVFDLDAPTVAGCAAVYDRAALIALPPPMRRRYADLLSRILPARCNMLLVTLDYDQQLMDGPPFAVSTDEVQTLYGSEWCISPLESRDILDQEPRFAALGLQALTTTTYMLQRGDQAER